jgi:glucose-1-phosphate thymidylyltransferase
VSLKNTIVGPYVSIGENGQILNSVIANTLVQNGTYIANKVIHNAMIGANAVVNGSVSDYSISDYSEITE